MSMHRTSVAALLLFVGVAVADDSPRLGVPLDAERIDAIDFTVLPDGDGLPAGSGTANQGRDLYRRHCLACHGESGEGGPNDRLAGGEGSLDGDSPVKTVGSYWPYATTLFDYLRRAMPYNAPGSLSDEELYAITAYVLALNGIIGSSEAINRETLPAVRMPNRDNVDFAWRPEAASRPR